MAAALKKTGVVLALDVRMACGLSDEKQVSAVARASAPVDITCVSAVYGSDASFWYALRNSH
jgi:hypothetical protein